MDGGQHLPVVGAGLGNGAPARGYRAYAGHHELGGVHEQARARTLLQAAALEIACHRGKLDELAGDVVPHPALVVDYAFLKLGGRVIEFERHEALASALL